MYVVNWLYGARDEAHAREIAVQGVREGLRYVGDDDARPLGSAQPWGSLWDDHGDPVTELGRMLEVRRAAVERFGPGALAAGEPVANLRRKFVPIWLLHRYQVEGAAKFVGGVDYRYSLRGDGQEAARIIPAAEQRRALDTLLATLRPDVLAVPPALLPFLSAGWSGNPDRQFDIEIFRTSGGTVFDPLAASDAAAMQTLNVLLAPDRLNRLAEQQRLDPNQLGASELLERLLGTIRARPTTDAALAGVQRRVATDDGTGARPGAARSGAFAAAGPCARRAAPGPRQRSGQAARRRSRSRLGPRAGPPAQRSGGARQGALRTAPVAPDPAGHADREQ
jgi:hypothetical protein